MRVLVTGGMGFIGSNFVRLVLVRAERELGWRPTRTFEEGLEETVRWYLENRGWWRRVQEGAYRASAEMIASWRGVGDAILAPSRP